MSPAALDNANPTILSPSLLPTRHKTVSVRTGPDSRYSEIIFSKPSFFCSPLSDDDASWPGGDIGSDSGFAPEPIDEQEIYGQIQSLSIMALVAKMTASRGADKLFTDRLNLYDF